MTVVHMRAQRFTLMVKLRTHEIQSASPKGNRPEKMIELPKQNPCEFCEGMAGRDETWAVIDKCELTQTVINPSQYEIGQCCVITRRHVGTLLELSDGESSAIIVAAKKVAIALVKTYKPLERTVVHLRAQRFALMVKLRTQQ